MSPDFSSLFTTWWSRSVCRKRREKSKVQDPLPLHKLSLGYQCMSSYSKKYKDSINRIILVGFISLYTHFSFGFGGVVWVSKKNINISTRLGTWYQAMTNINTPISASHTKQVEEYCICPVIILWLSASPINIALVQNKMKERVSKLTYPTLQHCLRMLYTMNGNSKH